MTIIDYILLTVALATCIFSWLDNRQSKKRELRLVDNWAESEKKKNEWIAEYDALQKNFNELNRLYQANKAELELYKNHNDNAKIKSNNKTHTMQNPKFEVHEAVNKEFYFLVRAANGEIIAASETYTTKQNCIKGINAVVEVVLSMKDDVQIDDLTQF